MRILSRQVYFYVVQKGDCLSSIAVKTGNSLSDLIKWNDIQNPDLIFPQQMIVLEEI